MRGHLEHGASGGGYEQQKDVELVNVSMARTRIIGQVQGNNRLFYNVTSKPPVSVSGSRLQRQEFLLQLGVVRKNLPLAPLAPRIDYF